MSSATYGVVVGGELNGLGVVRSLARGGVPSIVIESSRRRAAVWSRFCRPVILDRLHGRSLVEGLLTLQRHLNQRPVLFLTDEMAVNTVSSYRDELAPAYRFELPSPETVTTLGNKAEFYELAEQNGLPVPRTIVLRHLSDLAKLRDLRFPIIVKPADKRLVHMHATERLHMPVDIREARLLCKLLLEKLGELVVQEWIGGSDSNIYFCLFYRGRERSSTVMFTGRKLLSYPPKVGSTALCTAAPEIAESLETFTSVFIDLCAYRGFGSLEFKWDQARGMFVIIEPTVGRTDWQEEVATLNGVNIPLAVYRDAMGLANAKAVRPRHLVAWQESWRHLKRRFALQTSLPTHDGYWRVNDPVPALIYYGNGALTLTRRTLAVFAAKRAKRRRTLTATT